MKKLHLILVALLALAACNGRIDILDRAEACIEDNPELALQILDSLDSDSFHLPHQKARYSLLKSMALDKNYIDTADLSVIKPAFKYYSYFGSRSEKTLAYLYYSKVLINGDEYPKAIRFLNLALKSVPDDDYKTKILIYSSLNYVYNQSLNKEDELKYSELMYDNTVLSGDTSGLALSIYSLAMSYHNNKRFAASDSLCTLVFDYTDSLSAVAIESLRLQADNALYLPEPGYQTVIQNYEFISENDGLSEEDCYNFAYALLNAGDSEYADRVLALVDTARTAGTDLFLLARIEACKGEWRRSLEHYTKYMEFEDVYVKEVLSQSLYRAQSENYRLQSELDIRAKRNVILLSCVIVLTLSILFMAVYMTLRKRNIALRTKNEELERELGSLADLRKVYISMYHANFKASEYKLGETHRQEELKHKLNSDLDDVVTKICQDFPNLKENDINFICFMIAGFDNIEISSIVNLSKDNVRTKRSRLRKMILRSESPNLDLYRYVL